MQDPFVIYVDRDFRVEQCQSCPIPGYLIVHMRNPVKTFKDMPAALAARLGEILVNAVAAVEVLTDPENVYVLRFGEETRELHFHLFPRTPELTAAYFRHHSTGKTVAGPVFFDWARKFVADGGIRLETSTALAKAELLGAELKKRLG